MAKMDVDTEVEARLGQALVAFGQGSGGARVRSEVTAKVRSTFLEPFRTLLTNDEGKFHSGFPHVLDLFRTMGALSASYATSEGAACVESSHFDKAFQVVRTREEGIAGGRTDFC